jgi:hypothetical protein
MRRFRKTINIKLNLGEITDLLITYKPKARDAMRYPHSPEDCNKAMERLIRKLKKAEGKLKKAYKLKKEADKE